MHYQRSGQSVVMFHYVETFLQRSPVVLNGHSSFKIVNQHTVNIAKRRGGFLWQKTSKSIAFTRFSCHIVRFFCFQKVTFLKKKDVLFDEERIPFYIKIDIFLFKNHLFFFKKTILFVPNLLIYTVLHIILQKHARIAYLRENFFVFKKPRVFEYIDCEYLLSPIQLLACISMPCLSDWKTFLWQ